MPRWKFGRLMDVGEGRPGAVLLNACMKCLVDG